MRRISKAPLGQEAYYRCMAHRDAPDKASVAYSVLRRD